MKTQKAWNILICVAPPNAKANRRAAFWRTRVERQIILYAAQDTKCTFACSVTFRTNIL